MSIKKGYPNESRLIRCNFSKLLIFCQQFIFISQP